MKMFKKLRQFFRPHKWIVDEENHEILNPCVFAVKCKACGKKGYFLKIFGTEGCEKNYGCPGTGK